MSPLLVFELSGRAKSGERPIGKLAVSAASELEHT